MVTTIHILKFVIKLLLFIIFLPVIIIWLFIKYWRYKAVLVRTLVDTGMPRNFARQLARETKMSKIIMQH